MGVGVGKEGLEVNCCTMGPQTSVTTLVKEKKKRKKNLFFFVCLFFDNLLSLYISV